jgi:CDP-diacylglycerol--glycerol-3-phosphate 3-phosphatidyltransferase
MFTIKGRQMIKISGGLIPQKVQDGFIGLTKPLIKILIKLGIHPNTVTVWGVIITAFAAVILLMGHVRVGGLLILLGGLCDVLDGTLARSSNNVTRFGTFFDSTVDRYAEFIMFFGIAAYFLLNNDYWSSVAVFLALCGSLMVSYTRARAESLGFEAKIGLMQRPERIVIIGLGALIHPIALKFAIWLVAFFANYTAAQRIIYVYKQDVK